MHLSSLNWGRFLPLTSTISIALAGQSLPHKPQPTQRLILNNGCPRKFSDTWGFMKGYLVVAGLLNTYDTALSNIWGTRNFFTISHTTPLGSWKNNFEQHTLVQLSLLAMAGGEGFEPSTPNLGGWCSIRTELRGRVRLGSFYSPIFPVQQPCKLVGCYIFSVQVKLDQ